MRTNPLDIRGQPKGLIVTGVAGAAAVLFAAGGLYINALTTDARVDNVRAAVLAQGYGEATVSPIKGDECWRGREGFTWKTPAAHGSACAGPRDEVMLFPGIDRPHLSR